MGRHLPRRFIPEGIIHVGASSVPTDVLFRDDRDRDRFLWLLRVVVREHAWRCLAYCLMGNHFHLVLQLPEPTLSDGMCHLNGDYARGFNQRHDRTSNLFDGPFWSAWLETERHLYATIRYLALNPVNHGFTATPEDWPWSAHRTLAEARRNDPLVDVERALGLFDRSDALAGAQKYAAFVTGIDLVGLDGADVELITVLADPDREAGIARAASLGYAAQDIASVLDVHPRTIKRRLASISRATQAA